MVPTGNARHRRGWRCNFGVDENPLGFEIKMQNCKQKKGDASVLEAPPKLPQSARHD
jgi:hypothetical protein